MQEEENAVAAAAAAAVKTSSGIESKKGPGKAAAAAPMARSVSVPAMNGAVDADQASTATVQTKKKRALFNSKFNRSTDNISISSVSSSASVMIRKLGSIGKLARRNSIAGITSLFKDKNKDKDDEESGKKDKKKKGKAEAAEASVSLATAEADRGEWSADMNGLSPAARLARQHTLKSNAEAAERAKKQQQEVAAAQAAAAAQQQVDEDQQRIGHTWDHGTTSRAGSGPPKFVSAPRLGDNADRLDEEDEDDVSEDGTYRGPGPGEYGADAWDDDHSWNEVDPEEVDVTIRQGLNRVSIEEEGVEHEEEEPWAVGIRRSVERVATPAKGILKSEWGTLIVDDWH